MKFLWENEMYKLNIYIYIECDFIHFHSIKCKGSTMLSKISHLFMKHDSWRTSIRL
jgi:hypothetical protein